MREKYYTAKEIGKFLQKTDRWIRLLADKEYWDYKEVKKNGATEKRYAFSTLPMPIQAKIVQSQSTTEIVLSQDNPMNRLALEPYNRSVLEARLSALELFKEFHKTSGLTKDKALDKFIDSWSDIASEKTLEVLPTFKKRIFYNWEKALAQGGQVALAPKHGTRRGITKVPVEFQELILTTFLDQNQRTARSIHTSLIHAIAIKKLGEDVDLTELSQYKKELKKELSYDVLRRFIENKTSKGLRDKARGNKSQREQIQAYISRDPSNVMPNQIWCSDGHDGNNQIQTSDGRTLRPVVVVWMDIRSRMIMGFEVDETENTDLIISSLCNGVEHYGAPQYAYIDNGKAYINKRTADKVHSENKLKAYSTLGIIEQTARPYNGKEKPVERFWGTWDGRARYLPCYIGRNAEHKPERAEIDIKKGNMLTLDEYREAFAEFVKKYNTDVHTGKGMNGLSPCEVYLENVSDIRRVDKETISLLRMVTVADLRTVQGGGRIRYDNREYVAPELLHHVGEKVELALDPKNLNIAYVFYKGKFVAKAEGVVYADFFDSPQTHKARKQYQRQKSVEKKLNEKLIKVKKHQQNILSLEKTRVIEAVQDTPQIEVKKQKEFRRYGY